MYVCIHILLLYMHVYVCACVCVLVKRESAFEVDEFMSARALYKAAHTHIHTLCALLRVGIHTQTHIGCVYVQRVLITWVLLVFRE